MTLAIPQVSDQEVQFAFDVIAREFPYYAPPTDLTRELAALTNADPFSFGSSSSTTTRNSTDNWDGGFFGVDVTEAGKANCALQSVARISVADGNAWGLNSLVVTKTGEPMTTELGAWAGEFDVNHYGVDSSTIWVGAQNVKGVAVASGGTKRPFAAYSVETGTGKAPFVYGIRFSGQDNAGTWEPSVWASGSDIVSQTDNLAHEVISAHYQGNAQPAFSLLASGAMNWGDGTAGPDIGLERVGSKRLRSDGAIGFWTVTPPSARPTTPVTLANVITLLQSYGICS